MPNYARQHFDVGVADALRKPAKGSAFIDRKQAAKDIKAAEDALKKQVRALDKRCRWPHCENCRAFKPRLEVAHMEAKGMGGDHGERTELQSLILLDFLTHQGADGYERHERYIEPITEAGTRGPCAFYVKHYSETKVGEWRWRCVGVERSPGVLDHAITERVITNDGDYVEPQSRGIKGARMTDEQKNDDTQDLNEPQAESGTTAQADGDTVEKPAEDPAVGE